MIDIVGKGYYLWKVPVVENGDPVAIARVAKEAGLTHVLIKIANGVYAYNSTNANPKEYVTPLVEELHKNNILALGWHYVFGDNPVGEAQIAIKRIVDTGIDGYVIDAEQEYKIAGKSKSAIAFMAKLRLALPDFPIGLSSYRYPKLHPELPWKEFLAFCDFNMPQVYWEKSHNPGFQLQESKKQFDELYANLKIKILPFIPTGAAYKWDGWEPTGEDILTFFKTAKEMGLEAVNWWEWWCASIRLPHLWDLITAYEWSTSPNDPPPPPPELSLEERVKRLEIAVFGS